MRGRESYGSRGRGVGASGGAGLGRGGERGKAGIRGAKGSGGGSGRPEEGGGGGRRSGVHTLRAVCCWKDKTALWTRGSPWHPSARYSSSVSKGAPCTPTNTPSHKTPLAVACHRLVLAVIEEERRCMAEGFQAKGDGATEEIHFERELWPLNSKSQAQISNFPIGMQCAHANMA